MYESKTYAQNSLNYNISFFRLGSERGKDLTAKKAKRQKPLRMVTSSISRAEMLQLYGLQVGEEVLQPLDGGFVGDLEAVVD